MLTRKALMVWAIVDLVVLAAVFVAWASGRGILNEAVSLILLIALLSSVAFDAAHRTSVAVGVAILSVVFGILLNYFQAWQALAAVNFSTLVFLVAMGVFMAVMQRSGAFDWISKTLVLKSNMQPYVLISRILLLSYAISLFVNNVTVVMIMMPITLSICRQFDLSPVPLAVAQVVVINLGGASTMVGDFPNIIIATSVPELSFMDFMTNMFPICFALVIVTLLVLRAMHPEYFSRFEPGPAARVFAADLAERRDKAITDKPLLVGSVVVLAGMLIGFVAAAQLRIPLVLIPATGMGIILLVYEVRLRARYRQDATMDRMVRKNIVGDDISKLLAEVHWDVVLFLAALFIVVGSLEHTQVLTWAANFIIGMSAGSLVRASMLIIVIASFITLCAEAGPATAVLVPVIKQLNAGGLASGGVMYWALSLGVQAGSSTTMIGANEGPLAARMIEQDSRKHGSPNRLTAAGFTRIGGRVWLVFIPLSIFYLAGVIWFGWLVSLAAFAFAMVATVWIALFGLLARTPKAGVEPSILSRLRVSRPRSARSEEDAEP